MIYISNFADIFLKGINPVLDLVWVGMNNAVYKHTYERLLLAYGYGGDMMTMGSMHGAPTQMDIAWMLEEYENFGFWTYGMETAIAAYPLLNTFLSNGFKAFNTMIFEFADYDQSVFGTVINNGLTYKSDWYTDLAWYYRFNVFAQETMLFIYMAIYDPFALVQWWPRFIRATWNFTLEFFE